MFTHGSGTLCYLHVQGELCLHTAVGPSVNYTFKVSCVYTRQWVLVLSICSREVVFTHGSGTLCYLHVQGESCLHKAVGPCVIYTFKMSCVYTRQCVLVLSTRSR